jgi:23S rRNA pseudouridine955/2504/2580 synthase/23S rRNA pseudouridine1911/1915/1917 synthase
VLFEDDHLLALCKPPGLLTSPDRYDPARPNLMRLLHSAIADGKPWARSRGLTYLSNAHRLDFDTSGVILMAKTKPVLITLADLFGTDKPRKTYVALVHGTPAQDQFEVDAKLGPHPTQLGLMRVDPKNGKKSRTRFEVRERYHGWTLLTCRPVTGRTHQIRAHLRHARLPIAGDRVYNGRILLLSRIKRDFRLKEGHVERPLIEKTALHAETLELAHPVTGAEIKMTAPWPKALSVAVKYLRKYAVSGGAAIPPQAETQDDASETL